MVIFFININYNVKNCQISQIFKKFQKNVTRKNTHSKSSFERKMNSLLRKIIQLQRQIKFFHWNTKNYAAHKITDEFHTTLSGLVDQLVEVSISHKMKLANINKYYKKNII